MKTPYLKLFTLFGMAGILAGVIASSPNSGDAEDTTMSENTEPKTDQAQNEQEQGDSEKKEQDPLFNLFHKVYLFGLGVQRDIEETVKNLIDRGEVRAEEQQKVVDDFMKKAKENTGKVEEKINDMINKTLEGMNLVSKDKFDTLERRVQVLESKLLELEQRMKEQSQA
ncbi:hypothetical protein U14_02767 [Candidatus Moduliflexus flocculans]|uniref:Uncharacterized protein n=1 Tax=Candidatus Moduliflexus flocculans TaxID=1499966 RepID=A0A081BMA6_9BACT|nr:hypothetical protein U14_02767 [Candidatus Moduliflexus flocculans]